MYQYASNGPTGLTDPTGRFPVLLVVIPLIAGTANGLAELHNSGSFWQGFATGLAGAAIGEELTLVAGAGLLISAAGAALTSEVTRASLANEDLDVNRVTASVALSALGGEVAEQAFPTIGQLPSILSSSLGKNTMRLIGQESLQDALNSLWGILTGRQAKNAGGAACPLTH
jgi:hypothetical protein